MRLDSYDPEVDWYDGRMTETGGVGTPGVLVGGEGAEGVIAGVAKVAAPTAGRPSSARRVTLESCASLDLRKLIKLYLHQARAKGPNQKRATGRFSFRHYASSCCDLLAANPAGE
jgi:hypothetical protein